MNIIVQTTGGDLSSLNSKSLSPNKTLDNITRDPILNSIHKKELWCFAYQYYVWISHRADNRLCGDVPFFLWNGTISPYKHIIIWVVILYIINIRVTRNKLDDRSHGSYFVGYADTK